MADKIHTENLAMKEDSQGQVVDGNEPIVKKLNTRDVQERGYEVGKMNNLAISEKVLKGQDGDFSEQEVKNLKLVKGFKRRPTVNGAHGHFGKKRQWKDGAVRMGSGEVKMMDVLAISGKEQDVNLQHYLAVCGNATGARQMTIEEQPLVEETPNVDMAPFGDTLPAARLCDDEIGQFVVVEESDAKDT